MEPANTVECWMTIRPWRGCYSRIIGSMDGNTGRSEGATAKRPCRSRALSLILKPLGR
jgi:hypothetical protein